jgi:hypothetical protein
VWRGQEGHAWGWAEALQVAVEHWRAPQAMLGWLLRIQSSGFVTRCVVCVVADRVGEPESFVPPASSQGKPRLRLEEQFGGAK